MGPAPVERCQPRYAFHGYDSIMLWTMRIWFRKTRGTDHQCLNLADFFRKLTLTLLAITIVLRFSGMIKRRLLPIFRDLVQTA